MRHERRTQAELLRNDLRWEIHDVATCSPARFHSSCGRLLPAGLFFAQELREIGLAGADRPTKAQLLADAGTMKKRSSWRRTAGWVAALLSGMLGLAVLTGLREVRADPIVRRARIDLPSWPAGARPLKVALVSDIHLGNRAMDAGRLERVVAQVNSVHPDLILLAGDFVVGRTPVGAAERAAELTLPLARLKAPLGVIAVLGNHDYWTAPGAIRSALAKAGVTVLENQAIQRGPIALLGVADAFSGHDRAARAISASRALEGPRVILTHSPDLVADLPAGVPLILAGHTHCGQIVIPLIGPLLARAPREHWKRLYNPRYRCGLVRDQDRAVIVTAGVGSGTVPIRLGAPPDWWFLELGPEQ